MPEKGNGNEGGGKRERARDSEVESDSNISNVIAVRPVIVKVKLTNFIAIIANITDIQRQEETQKAYWSVKHQILFDSRNHKI